jgi:hypothetical protein
LRIINTVAVLFILINSLLSQAPALLPEEILNPQQLEKHIHYLASDALQGRNTGEAGNIQAARFISDYFEKAGVNVLKGAKSPYQKIPIAKIEAGEGAVYFLDVKYEQGNQILFLQGKETGITTDVVFLGFGDTEESYTNANIKGKVVIVWQGTEESRNPMDAWALSRSKVKWAYRAQSAALIELYNIQMPWVGFKNYFKRERLEIQQDSGSDFPHAILFIEDKEQIAKIRNNELKHQGTISFSGMKMEYPEVSNVLGYIPGSDERLKEEYVLLSAHFDHVGIKKGVTDGLDSVYNGARDNAIGTAALLAAADYFVNNPPKRSIILAAWNGEEKGLLGSRYFAENPLLPLKKIIFNINIDNAGYNDTTAVSVIGYKRTGATDEMDLAVGSLGLKVIADPAEKQNLFDRSDNVSFASKGIPAPSYSMGFTEFDSEVSKHYHQLSDHSETLDFTYISKYVASYLLAARLVADRTSAPKWISGDKYEETAKALYGY